MCGILSLITSKEQKELIEDKNKFTEALSESKRRGPDGSQVESVGGQALFGFNRLIIQDLTPASMQPFVYEGNTLVFNGEIYNFIELREELEKEGLKFQTTGDSEVLAAGLTKHGGDFIKKLNGIYAFVFYNAKDKKFLIGRDKFGVKPLFYYRENGYFIFSSEITSILKYVSPVLETSYLHTNLFLDWFVGHQKDKTFLKDILCVEPGSLYELDENLALKKTRYYVPNLKTRVTDDLEKIEQDFEKLFHKSIDWETRSDVPVGVILSGGIDSTAVMSIATPDLIKKQDKIPTFTYYFEKKGENSDVVVARQLIDFFTEKYGQVFDPHELNLDKDLFIEDFMEAARAKETPVLDVRYILKMKNYQNAKASNVKAVLHGQGADEVYYGYYPLDYWMSIFYREGIFDTENILEYFTKLNEKKFNLYRKDFLDKAKETTREYLNKVFTDIGKVENQQKKITAFLRENMLPSMLEVEDKMGMYSGIEVRVPMINPLMVEYVDACDYKVNLASTTSGRHLFRKALEKVGLPHSIIYREKSPGPKKKDYSDELLKIIDENKDGIYSSPLVSSVYDVEKVKDMISSFASTESKDQPFYGGINDVMVEIIGLYAFEESFDLKIA